VLRLAGIESFALLKDDGDAAESALRDRLQVLAAGQDVQVRILGDELDRYGRLSALVWLKGPQLLQEALAREGLAIAYSNAGPLPCFDRILAAEDDARRNRAGFWRDEPLPRAEPGALQPRIGRFAIFEGVVRSVGARRNRTSLNFGRRWSEDVTVEIDARRRADLGGDSWLKLLAGLRVRVRGFVKSRGGPVVTIASRSEIELLGKAGSSKESEP
jgi:hypothetical protein